ncbi:MAG: DUF4268 domain-containing protein [Nitrospinae bacterium]|nr:DUF4268 domain-containing protein [Nitrospinota bacterium]
MTNTCGIEKVFGGALEWQELEGRRACRIRKTIRGGYRDPEESWPQFHENMVDTMIALEKALTPHIRKLKVQQ